MKRLLWVLVGLLGASAAAAPAQRPAPSVNLAQSYVATAEGILDSYRASPDPWLYEFDWHKAEICLVTAIALGSNDDRTQGKLALSRGYATLERDERVAVAKMAAVLRIADALDESRSQRIHEIQVEREADRLVISVPMVEDLSLETLAITQNGQLFEETFGASVLLRMARA